MDVFVCRTSLRALLKTKYDNKISSAMNPADPVEDQMREWFDSEGLCELYTDEKRFEAEAEMVEPCGGGTIVAESQRDDGVTTRIQAYELATNEKLESGTLRWRRTRCFSSTPRVRLIIPILDGRC